MPGPEEKARRKAVRDSLRQAERDAIRASLPCAVEEMNALFDFVDARLSEHECDNTLRFTSEFAANTRLNSAAVIAWLENAGGYCDCEVVANAEEKFRTAFPSI